MSNSLIFQFCSTLAMLNWLLLIFAPHWKWTRRIVSGVGVTFLAILYAVLVFQTLQIEDFSSFNSLEGVVTLFSQEQAVLVGWIHYLAFDLLTGYYITKDAAKHQIHHAFVIPCLLFTFMLGPVGFLLYVLLRLWKTKEYFWE